MTDLSALIERASGIHNKLANSHPSLSRGIVWCTQCGFSQSVSSAHAMKHGWPKHCGYTMTFDSPEERAALKAKEQSHD